ncbi:MAG TPA: ATP-binding protein [Candidatus Limnocylindria bacterium]|nr:ATP-binding protein [Candidatus Limnocylindria bacterium]
MRFLNQLFAPSLLRALVGRTIAVAVGALVLLAAVALYESNDLITKQFDDEATIVAQAALNDIRDQSEILQRQASLLAGLPNVRELAEAKDRNALDAFLLPQKSRLLVTFMNVADLDGVLIGGAQDFTPGDKLKPDLVELVKARAQQSWSLYDETQGIVIRAIYVIRGKDQEPIGYMEVGSVLDNAYLKTINTKSTGATASDAQLALVWNGIVRASTTTIPPNVAFPTVDQVDNAVGDVFVQEVDLNGQNYYGIFQVIRAQVGKPGVLAVMLPLQGLNTAQQTLLGILFVLATGLIALVTFFAYRSATAMTTPLAQLAAAAQQIEAGDLGVRIPQRSQHEIGTLERAFDTMARSLSERERAQQEYLAEVRTVNEVADAVVGVTDRERIFAESLSRMVALFHADGASIVIREDAPGSPQGSGGRLIAPTTIGIDADTAVMLATRVLVNPVYDPNQIQHLHVPQSPMPHVAHIPLSARGRAAGLLSAYFKTPREITDTEARALRTIARLVSVAKENADLVNELKDNNLQLERANRLKSEFLASVSHELRTPMNAIIGYTKLMLDGLDGDLTEQQTADLERVVQAADNLLGLINGLLDLAKIEAGKMELNVEEVDIPLVIDDVIELMRASADAKGLSLRADIGSALPTAWADRARIRQVLVNLVANAVKFTEHGGVTIRATVVDGWITLAVVDTGVGIPPEAQTYIFDEFRQVDASTTRRYGGTGLGLAISKRLIALHGGRIWVDSSVGVGSSFLFTLPVRVRAAALADGGLTGAVVRS